MTTESQSDPRARGTLVLVGAAAAGLTFGLAAALAGGLVVGSSAAYAALAGTLLVLAVLGFGSTVVNTVAGLMPAASLMVALLTYVLQVVLMGLVFAALSGSGLLDDTLDREWLAGVVIGGTFVWLAAQVVLATTIRIPVYDLPVEDSTDPVVSAAGPRTEAGDR